MSVRISVCETHEYGTTTYLQNTNKSTEWWISLTTRSEPATKRKHEFVVLNISSLLYQQSKNILKSCFWTYSLHVVLLVLCYFVLLSVSHLPIWFCRRSEMQFQSA